MREEELEREDALRERDGHVVNLRARAHRSAQQQSESAHIPVRARVFERWHTSRLMTGLAFAARKAR